VTRPKPVAVEAFGGVSWAEFKLPVKYVAALAETESKKTKPAKETNALNIKTLLLS
jgi:hypothetical protein